MRRYWIHYLWKKRLKNGRSTAWVVVTPSIGEDCASSIGGGQAQTKYFHFEGNLRTNRREIVVAVKTEEIGGLARRVKRSAKSAAELGNVLGEENKASLLDHKRGGKEKRKDQPVSTQGQQKNIKRTVK